MTHDFSSIQWLRPALKRRLDDQRAHRRRELQVAGMTAAIAREIAEQERQGAYCDALPLFRKRILEIATEADSIDDLPGDIENDAEAGNDLGYVIEQGQDRAWLVRQRARALQHVLLR